MKLKLKWLIRNYPDFVCNFPWAVGAFWFVVIDAFHLGPIYLSNGFEHANTITESDYNFHLWEQGRIPFIPLVAFCFVAVMIQREFLKKKRG